MKQVADAHYRDVHFDVEDWVYLKLCPYRQMSLSPIYNKLSKHYYGPVAYRLLLPASSRIHPVFHVSLLKLHQGPMPFQPAPLPPMITNNHPFIEPLSLLD